MQPGKQRCSGDGILRHRNCGKRHPGHSSGNRIALIITGVRLPICGAGIPCGNLLIQSLAIVLIQPRPLRINKIHSGGSSLFANEWQCVGRASRIPEVGDYFTTTVNGDPIIVARAKDGSVRAFSSICQHRGMQVADDAGNANADLPTLTVRVSVDGLPGGRLVGGEAKRPARQLVMLAPGSQGEPTSPLNRMAQGEHRQVQVKLGDTIIISGGTIPGNETEVGRIERGFETGQRIERAVLVARADLGESIADDGTRSGIAKLDRFAEGGRGRSEAPGFEIGIAEQSAGVGLARGGPLGVSWAACCGSNWGRAGLGGNRVQPRPPGKTRWGTYTQPRRDCEQGPEGQLRSSSVRWGASNSMRAK